MAWIKVIHLIWLGDHLYHATSNYNTSYNGASTYITNNTSKILSFTHSGKLWFILKCFPLYRIGAWHLCLSSKTSTKALSWHYGNTGCRVFKRGYKIRKKLPKNQHTQRKLLNSENWCNGEVPKFDFQSQFSTSKIIRISEFSFHRRVRI